MSERPLRDAAPLTVGLPFVDSPTGLLLCLGAYFVIVLFGVAVQAGRAPVAAAAKRPDPAWLRLLVLVHNTFLVALSLFMSAGYGAAGRQYGCKRPSPQARRAAA